MYAIRRVAADFQRFHSGRQKYIFEVRACEPLRTQARQVQGMPFLAFELSRPFTRSISIGDYIFARCDDMNE
jgi:hypothetical protein